jgi:hypothetical protein
MKASSKYYLSPPFQRSNAPLPVASSGGMARPALRSTNGSRQLCALSRTPVLPGLAPACASQTYGRLHAERQSGIGTTATLGVRPRREVRSDGRWRPGPVPVLIAAQQQSPILRGTSRITPKHLFRAGFVAMGLAHNKSFGVVESSLDAESGQSLGPDEAAVRVGREACHPGVGLASSSSSSAR